MKVKKGIIVAIYAFVAGGTGSPNLSYAARYDIRIYPKPNFFRRLDVWYVRPVQAIRHVDNKLITNTNTANGSNSARNIRILNDLSHSSLDDV
jgi:hypothetical protein